MGNISTHYYSEYKYSYLSIERLENALNKLIKRHLTLRTIFINGQQQYLKELKYYKIKMNELTSEDELLNIRNELSHKIYKLDSYPLFDILISKMPDYYILHISFDIIALGCKQYDNLL